MTTWTPLTQLKRVARLAKAGLQVGVHEVRDRRLAQKVVQKPRVLSYLVNDICNSRCQMCNIWQQKRDVEMRPEQLADVLGDALFANVEYVGLSGGEPTLRADLPDLFDVVCQSLPNLKGTGIITNAIQADTVVERVVESARRVRRHGKQFYCMVSLDGVGEVHDLVRGRKGNFASAQSVLRALRAQEPDLQLLLGCTVVKDNVWHVDDVLEFARREDVHARFRVAEHIDRLYTDADNPHIRTFDDEERYHLGLFFKKLENTYEHEDNVRRTYVSLQHMLLDGAPRQSGCPWQSHAATMDCRGQIMYCAPRSPIIANLLDDNSHDAGWDAFRGQVQERQSIVDNHCSSCVHDYHEGASWSQWTQEKTQRVVDESLSFETAQWAAKSLSDAADAPPAPARSTDKVLIVGWYGTETAGDKAILRALLDDERAKGVTNICVASLYPSLTRWTVKELGHGHVSVIPATGTQLLQAARDADEVVMGGGPLMAIDPLRLVLWAFVAARSAGRRTRIAGCGLGPLPDDGVHTDAVATLLRLSHVVQLRDSASAAWAKRLSPGCQPQVTGDPAVHCIRAMRPTTVTPSPFIHLYLREWPVDYNAAHRAQHEEQRAAFEAALGQQIRWLCEQTGRRPRLLPMHHFVIGDDDRDFARRFARDHLQGVRPVVEHRPLTLQELVTSFAAAPLNICMRFHSVVFAHTLQTPFWAVDYTLGGKIEGFLDDNDMRGRLVRIRDIVDADDLLLREHPPA